MSTEFETDALLRHWFADTRENPDTVPERVKWWYTQDASRDRWLADTWGDACLLAMDSALHFDHRNAHARLAMILLTDQLPRNIFRGQARAFASDPIALDLCLNGHRRGQDTELTPIERTFFWMPLQHAEDLALQDLGVELFDSLAQTDPYRAALWKGFASYAHNHRELIARFGRFPHRNEVLQRESTPEEIAYLEGGGATFGQ